MRLKPAKYKFLDSTGDHRWETVANWRRNGKKTDKLPGFLDSVKLQKGTTLNLTGKKKFTFESLTCHALYPNRLEG